MSFSGYSCAFRQHFLQHVDEPYGCIRDRAGRCSAEPLYVPILMPFLHAACWCYGLLKQSWQHFYVYVWTRLCSHIPSQINSRKVQGQQCRFENGSSQLCGCLAPTCVNRWEQQVWCVPGNWVTFRSCENTCRGRNLLFSYDFTVLIR